MKTTVEIGCGYALRSELGGVVTNAQTGKMLETLQPNKQIHMTAQEPEWDVPDDCQVTKVKGNFNYAPIGSADGGGSAHDVAPGYLMLSYVLCTNDEYIDAGLQPTTATGVLLTVENKNTTAYKIAAGATSFSDSTRNYVPLQVNLCYVGYCDTSGSKYLLTDGSVGPNSSSNKYTLTGVATATFNYKNDAKWTLKDAAFSGEASLNIKSVPFNLRIGARNYNDRVAGEQYHITWDGYIFKCVITEGQDVVRDYVPAMSNDGVVVLYDKVNKVAYPSIGTGAFGAGITSRSELTALLNRLPFTGGSLNLSLPANMQGDAEVDTMLTEATTSRGWTLTVKDYRALATGASTYGIRRTRSSVWLKAELDEAGTYVDSENLRWRIDSCVAIYGPMGADPTDYGYEPFDSVEQAAEEWKLVPYVEPEMEEIAD